MSESEFARICSGLREDRESILKHNPMGSDEETLLWMLLNTLVIYLSLEEIEMPCFSGRPDTETYRRAIEFVLKDRRKGKFSLAPHIDNLVSK
ncbi:hypothetical protein [Leptolyngbya sp. 7M]|uniref:hypothetical protein n=1 Tax=Leptolyngbya sp. 7M TaxID=2812896 RepID=UPI001B8C6CDA|nr:hypothetical protein [Leptolyngbya sp. 7M]QYO65869.1 hypothetical protein JVX88_03470 [Leptolyngbya sp. 7M]